MPAARYSDEFKTQVVREVIEKERTIASVAASYDLVAQTVGNWVARYKREHATDQDRKKETYSQHPSKALRPAQMPASASPVNKPQGLRVSRDSKTQGRGS